MTESEADVLRRLQTLAKELNLTYRIEVSTLDSASPMNIDSLEFISLIIEIQRGFELEIPDEEIQEKNLRVLRNLVDHLMAHSKTKA